MKKESLNNKNNNTFQRKIAFTLAEVLITLGIIGVVAVLTISVLTKNIQNIKYYSAFQKSYSTISQITESLLLENNNMAGVVPGYSSFSQAFFEKSKNTRFCPSTTAIGDCWPSTLLLLDNNTDFMSGFAMDTILFLDGSAVAIREWSYDCSTPLSGLNDVCFEIFLDTNSLNGPNKWGRDIFLFLATKNKLYPKGAPGLTQEWNSGNTWYCNPSVTDSNAGKSCASRLLQEGAMKY